MRLSLQAVEAMSDQEFKASVLGAYERGERAISVSSLQRLAKLYDVRSTSCSRLTTCGHPVGGVRVRRGPGAPLRPAGHSGRIRAPTRWPST